MENTNKTKIVNCGAFGNIIRFHRITSPILYFQSRTANKSEIPNKLNFFQNKFLEPKLLFSLVASLSLVLKQSQPTDEKVDCIL